MRFVIQIFDDADLAFRVFGAELRTVLSTTTVLADKPLRLSGRAIAQRFSAMTQSGHAANSTSAVVHVVPAFVWECRLICINALSDLGDLIKLLQLSDGRKKCTPN